VGGVNKSSAIGAVIAATAGYPVIFTTGYTCRIAQHIADRGNHFYMTGSMGLAASIGIGVALETRRTTIVVDGDGSLLMNPVGLIVAGGLPDLPLVHVLLDDGQYASTGGQSVPSGNLDLCALATASGYQRAVETSQLDRFSDLVRSEIASCTGPVFIRGELGAPDSPVPGRIGGDLGDHALRFRAQLAASGPVRSRK
jgi:sulfopyruvate decarboxylase subunit beta